MFTTEIIDNEKRQELQMLFDSNNDTMTGLLNRRAYEKDINIIFNNNDLKDFIYISADVNGLKRANDSIGHAAGDELIIGASVCLSKCFDPYGHVYRIGGDEFIALIHAKETELEIIKNSLETTM